MRCRIHFERSNSSSAGDSAAASSHVRTCGSSSPGSPPTDSKMSSEDPTSDTAPFYQTLGVRSCAVDRIWLQACFDFARDRGIEARYVDALHAFAYPNPRGGPPPPPEPRWSGDFEQLEARLCGEALRTPALRDALIDDLSREVDPAQAQMFARRISAVEDQLVALDDATGRLLRVGLRQRLEGIRAAPRPRARAWLHVRKSR